MSLEQLRQLAKKGTDYDEAVNDHYTYRNEPSLFDKKIAVQSFMNSNDYLISFFLSEEAAKAAEHPDPRFHTLEGASRYALELSQKIASVCTGKSSPHASEVRLFRATVARRVVDCIRAGRPLDEDRLLQVIQEVVRVADTSADTSPYRDFDPNDRGRWMLTVSSIAMRVKKVVETYAFREQEAPLINRLVGRILTTAITATDRIINSPDMDFANRMNLAQTTAQKLSHIMVGAYREEIKEVLPQLLKLPEAEREPALRQGQHIEKIERKFDERAADFINIVENQHSNSFATMYNQRNESRSDQKLAM